MNLSIFKILVYTLTMSKLSLNMSKYPTKLAVNVSFQILKGEFRREILFMKWSLLTQLSHQTNNIPRATPQSHTSTKR